MSLVRCLSGLFTFILAALCLFPSAAMAEVPTQGSLPSAAMAEVPTQGSLPLTVPEKGVSVEATVGNTVGTAAFYATVAADGTLAQGVGAVSAQKFGTGYEVIFNTDVSRGSYVATVACSDPSTWCNPPANIVSVSPRQDNAQGVFIHTFDSNGKLTNSGFNLIVVVD